MNLVTPKAGSKHEHLFNKLASTKFMPYLPHRVSGLFADDKECPKILYLSGAQLRPSSFASHSSTTYAINNGRVLGSTKKLHCYVWQELQIIICLKLSQQRSKLLTLHGKK